MPLPKAPTKRASRLEASAFETTLALSKPAAPRKTPTPAEAPMAAPIPAEPAPNPAPVLKLAPKTATPALFTPVTAKAEAPATPPSPKLVTKPAAKAKTPRKNSSGVVKLFVLDTNVLMHDPMSLFRFEEHDIYLPMITLEELDGHKKGMTEVSRNVRQVSRELDALAASLRSSSVEEMAKGLPLDGTGHKEAGGKLFFQTQLVDAPLPAGLPQGKADNQILAVVQALKLK